MSLPNPQTESISIIAKSWEEFDAKAKELIETSHTNITPADESRALTIGYIFENPEKATDAFWLAINIKDLKDTRSDEIKDLMQSERGRHQIAENWIKKYQKGEK